MTAQLHYLHSSNNADRLPGTGAYKPRGTLEYSPRDPIPRPRSYEEIQFYALVFAAIAAIVACVCLGVA